MDTPIKDYDVEKNASLSETLTDIDGNVYKIVKIGKQIWMAENLKVARYCNGDEIPNVTENSSWADLSTGARCAYENKKRIAEIYGYLYNWFSVNDSRNIAPKGWHVPADYEWMILEKYLGMIQSEVSNEGDVCRGMGVGGKLKEKLTSHWKSRNEGATNESSFSGLPGGLRVDDGRFVNLRHFAMFWSATEFDADSAWSRYLWYWTSCVYRRSREKQDGYSIRLIRD